MKELQIFNFDNSEVRTVLINEEPYFVGKDVAEILGYSETYAMTKRLDEEDVMSAKLSGMNMRSTLINESGLYTAVIGSQLPNAKKFKRWVTSEVLPTIRKTGSYSVPSNPMAALKLMFEATEQTQQQVQNVSDRVQTLEDDTPLSSSEYGYITRKINQKVMEFAGLKRLEDDADAKKLLFKDINTGVHAIAGVTTRSQLRNRHFDDVVSYVRDWMPSQSTLVLIERLVS